MKSFQVPRKVKIASVTRIGPSKGTTIETEDPQLARAVDARRLEQLIGYRERILAHQEDAEDAGQAGTITPA